MPYELIATLMFSTMMLMLLTGQRVFGAIGFVAVVAALLLWGDRGGFDIGFAAAIKESLKNLLISSRSGRLWASTEGDRAHAQTARNSRTS